MAKEQKLALDEMLDQALVPSLEQPYKVPGNWVWVYLGKGVGIKRGASPRPISNYITNDANGVNWIRIGDTDDGKYVLSTKQKIIPEGTNKSVYVKKGTLILSNSMSFGRPYILDIDGCIHDGWLAIETSEGIDKEYMYYTLLSSNWYFEQVAVGTAVRNLNSDRVAGLPFPLPPLPEQHRIVAVIESLFGKLDRAKELAQNALDSFENRKSAILHKAFTGELTRKWREENGVEIESWKEHSLDQVCFKITDGTHHSPKNYESGEFMYVTAKNIKETGIDLSNITYVSEADFTSIFSRCNVEFGDVLYIKDGATTGIAAINTLQERFAMLSSVALLKPNTNLLYPKYLVWNLNSPKTKSKMINNMSGNAITRLTISKIKESRIVLPQLEEQEEIVRILDDLLEKERKAKELCDVIDNIEHMKKAILVRAFRGELGTNNPEEESAKELLKSILEAKINSVLSIKEEGKAKKKESVLILEEINVPKTVLEALREYKSLTPETLKAQTGIMDIDDFYAELKSLVETGAVIERREGDESYLEVKDAGRQA